MEKKNRILVYELFPLLRYFLNIYEVFLNKCQNKKFKICYKKIIVCMRKSQDRLGWQWNHNCWSFLRLIYVQNRPPKAFLDGRTLGNKFFLVVRKLLYVKKKDNLDSFGRFFFVLEALVVRVRGLFLYFPRFVQVLFFSTIQLSS